MEQAHDIILDAWPKGQSHVFFGNQFVSQGAHSKAAVQSSMKAKSAMAGGSASAQKKAHKSAYHSHSAAADEATTKKGRKYHKLMAKFHGHHAGLTLDAVEFDEPELAESPVLDAVETSLSIVGRIYVGGELKGRALIGGDGKAMVYKGAEGTERVSFTSPVDGAIRTAMWSDGDAPDMVGWLLNPPAALTSSPFDAFMDSGKQTWQVTRAEWVSLMVSEYSYLGTPANESNKDDFRQHHREQVKVALDAGKAVPAEVLADYPGMKAESAEDKDARVAEAEVRLKAALGIPGATVEDTTDYIAVAQTIGAQLGGSKFKAMTGAKDFMSLTPKGGDAPRGGLRFSLPANFAFGGINRVFIRLNDMDTYDLEFGKATFSKTKGSNYKVIESAEGVYAENLREVFTERTGLDVSLGTGGPQVKTEAAPKRVTMKEARDAYSMLEYSVDDLSGHQNAEFLRADVLGRLEPKMLLIKALVERGWPEQVYSPEGLLKKAQGLIDRHEAMSASGLTEDMGQSEAWGYLTHDKKLPAERVDQILATPSRVEKSGGQMNADVPKYTMAYLNAEADKQAALAGGDASKVRQSMEETKSLLEKEKSYSLDMQKPARIKFYTEFLAYLQDVLDGKRKMGEGKPDATGAEEWNKTNAVIQAQTAQQESTTVEEQSPVAQVAEAGTDVNAANYAWAQKSIGYEPNRPPNRPFKLHSKKNPYGIGAPFGVKEGMNAMNQYFESEEAAKAWGEKNGYVVGPDPYDKKVKQVSEPMQEQAPSVDPAKATDTAYIQTIIDGTADLLDPGLYDKLEPLFAKYEADPEMMALLTKAADAYGKAVEAAAMGALGR
jgi:hypothetical protein